MPLLSPLNPAQLVAGAKRVVLTATQRLRPDHRAISYRRVRFLPQNMGRLYLYVVVAPSRYAPRPVDDGQVGRARVFAADAFPGVFSDKPKSAEAAYTLFAVDSDDGFHDRALYVHPTGLVELLWTLETEQALNRDDEELMGMEGSVVLDAAEMAEVIAQLATAVGRRPYTEISQAGRGRRHFARVDWWFHLATGVAGANGHRYWTALKFAGPAPPRAEHQYAAAPMEGYGAERLRSQRRTTPPEHIVSTFLSELLTANGYYEFRATVEQTVLLEQQRRKELTAGEAEA